MPHKNDLPYLLHIKDALNDISRFTQGMDFTTFYEDDLVSSGLNMEKKLLRSFLKNLQKNTKGGFQPQIFGILSSFTLLFLIRSKFSTFRVENLKSFPQLSTTKVEN